MKDKISHSQLKKDSLILVATGMMEERDTI